MGNQVIIPLFYMSAGFVLFAGLESAILAYLNPQIRRRNLVFFLLALCATGYQVFSALYLQSSDLSASLFYLHGQFFFIPIALICIYSFVAEYTGQKSQAPGLQLLVVCAVVMYYIDLTSTYSIRYYEVEGLKELTYSWGETLHVVQGAQSRWFVFVSLVSLVMLVWAVYRATKELKSARYLSAYILLVWVFLQIVTAIYGSLITSGAIEGFYIAGFPISLLVILMSMNLSIDTRAMTVALSEKTRQLEQQVNRTALAKQRAERIQAEKLHSLGRMVSGVAHEMNTPIGNASMALSTLEDSLGQFKRNNDAGLTKSALEAFVDDVDIATKMAVRNVDRAAELIHAFKQVSSDQATEIRRQIDLSEHIKDILLMLRPTLKRTPYTVEQGIQRGIKMETYPGALGQVISNLINNAVIHGFDGRDYGTIKIDAVEEGENVRLIVSDDGMGIPMEDQARVFDPFFTTRGDDGGTGLGLNISYSLVTQVLGGTIDLESQSGKGTVFTLNLPANIQAGGA